MVVFGHVCDMGMGQLGVRFATYSVVSLEGLKTCTKTQMKFA
jgi:hypothetical protein